MSHANNVAVASRISWGAIFAGTVVALIVQLTLSVLGVAIGFSGISPQTGTTPDISTISVAAGLWWLVSSMVASIIGGFVAGRLISGVALARGSYHGLISWATTTMLVLVLVGSAAGGVLGGAFGAASNFLGGAGRAMGGAVQAAAPMVSGASSMMRDIERQIRGATGGQDPAQLRDTAISAVKAALTGDSGQQEQATKEAAAALAQARGTSVEDARAEINRYQQQYAKMVEDTKATAARLAEASARVATKGALLAFFALVLGGLAGAFGGRYGAALSRRDLEEEYLAR